MSNPTGFICGPRIYEYNGMTFEYGPTTCWPLRKDGEPKTRFSKADKAALDKFWDMSEEERDTHRTGGGCRQF